MSLPLAWGSTLPIMACPSFSLGLFMVQTLSRLLFPAHGGQVLHLKAIPPEALEGFCLAHAEPSDDGGIKPHAVPVLEPVRDGPESVHRRLEAVIKARFIGFPRNLNAIVHETRLVFLSHIHVPFLGRRGRLQERGEAGLLFAYVFFQEAERQIGRGLARPGEDEGHAVAHLKGHHRLGRAVGLHPRAVQPTGEVFPCRLDNHGEEIIATGSGKLPLEAVPVLSHEAAYQVVKALALHRHAVDQPGDGVIPGGKRPALHGAVIAREIERGLFPRVHNQLQHAATFTLLFSVRVLGAAATCEGTGGITLAGTDGAASIPTRRVVPFP